MYTFGTYIKATRLGFHWSHRLNCFMRIDGDGPPWRFDLAPGNNIPCIKKGSHRCWWECKEHGNDCDHLVEESPVLKSIKQVKRHISFELNDEGLLIAGSILGAPRGS